MTVVAVAGYHWIAVTPAAAPAIAIPGVHGGYPAQVTDRRYPRD